GLPALRGCAAATNRRRRAAGRMSGGPGVGARTWSRRFENRTVSHFHQAGANETEAGPFDGYQLQHGALTASACPHPNYSADGKKCLQNSRIAQFLGIPAGWFRLVLKCMRIRVDIFFGTILVLKIVYKTDRPDKRLAAYRE